MRLRRHKMVTLKMDNSEDVSAKNSSNMRACENKNPTEGRSESERGWSKKTTTKKAHHNTVDTVEKLSLNFICCSRCRRMMFIHFFRSLIGWDNQPDFTKLSYSTSKRLLLVVQIKMVIFVWKEENISICPLPSPFSNMSNAANRNRIRFQLGEFCTWSAC